MLWDERLDGARPRSCRRRRNGRVCSDEEEADGPGFVEARWWWARRDEMADPREDDKVGSGFWGDGIFSVGSGTFSGEVDRLGCEVLGEISRRGPDVGRKVWEDSSSGLVCAVVAVSLVVFVSGSWFSFVCDGLVEVDQGSGSTMCTRSLELGVTFVICLYSPSGCNDFPIGLFDVISVLSRVLSLLQGLAALPWPVGASAPLDTRFGSRSGCTRYGPNGNDSPLRMHSHNHSDLTEGMPQNWA